LTIIRETSQSPRPRSFVYHISCHYINTHSTRHVFHSRWFRRQPGTGRQATDPTRVRLTQHLQRATTHSDSSHTGPPSQTPDNSSRSSTSTASSAVSPSPARLSRPARPPATPSAWRSTWLRGTASPSPTLRGYRGRLVPAASCKQRQSKGRMYDKKERMTMLMMMGNTACTSSIIQS